MQSNCKVHFGGEGEESGQLDIPGHHWGPNIKLMVECWQQKGNQEDPRRNGVHFGMREHFW